MKTSLPVILDAARAAAGWLPDWMKVALYRAPGVSDGVRWLLTRTAPPGPVVVEVASGLARGLRLRVDLKTQKYYWLGTHEMLLQRVLEREVRPGATVYDVGAHLGFFTLGLAQLVEAAGRVVAFEPLPANAAALRENVALNPALAARVRVVEAALADVAGRTALFADASPTMARITAATSGHTRTLEVESLTLDDWVFSRGEPPPDLVKMDIEGAEGKALAGGRRVLREHRPFLAVEVHGEEPARAVWDELRCADYRVMSLGGEREFQSPAEYTRGHVLGIPR